MRPIVPTVVEMCHRIDAMNAELKDLLAKANTMTPDIEKKLAEAAQLRLECQQAMLEAFHGGESDHAPRSRQTFTLAWVAGTNVPAWLWHEARQFHGACALKLLEKV